MDQTGYPTRVLARSCLALLVALAIGVGLSGCLGSGETTSPGSSAAKPTVSAATATSGRTTTTSRTTPKADEQWATWGEAVVVDRSLRMTVEAPVRDPAATPVSIPGFEGQQVVYCLITIENIGSVDISYDERHFELRAEGESWGGGYEGLTVSTGCPLGSGFLRPGESVRGVVAFQLTDAGVASIREVVYQSRPSPSTVVIHWAH